MDKALTLKLEGMRAQYAEVCRQLTQKEVIAEQSAYRKLCQECARLKHIVEPYEQYRQCLMTLKENEQLAREADQEIKQLAREELLLNRQKLRELEEEIKQSLLPQADA